MVGLFLLFQVPVYACYACHHGSYGGASKAAVLLLALAAGYGVLVLSQSQSRPLNVIGRVIGGIVLVVSLIGLICVGVSRVWCKKGAQGKFGGTKFGCPMSFHQMDSMKMPEDHTSSQQGGK
jgi:hypothetical protein